MNRWMKWYGQSLVEHLDEISPEMGIVDSKKRLPSHRFSLVQTEAVWQREERVKHSVLGDRYLVANYSTNSLTTTASGGHPLLALGTSLFFRWRARGV